MRSYRRARVWLDEPLPCAFRADETLRTSVAAVASATTTLRRAAVEIFVPLGAKFDYGLVGGEWRPGTGNRLHVTVGVTTAPQAAYRESLSGRLEDVEVGLLREYAAAIVDEIEFGPAAPPAIAGALTIAHAAHGTVGSSASIFWWLTDVLMQLLALDDRTPDDAELLALMDATPRHRPRRRNPQRTLP
jgi:hypothetical protein